MPGPNDPQNPYAPTPAAASAEVYRPPLDSGPPVHTSAPKVFGVLSIIFASIVMLFGLLASCGGLLGGSVTQFGDMAGAAGGSKAAELRAVFSTVGTIYTAMGIQGLVLTILSSLLLAIGVGQLRYRAWACRWSVYWGGLALVAVAGMVAVSMLLIGPAYQKMIETMAHAAPSGAIPMGMAGGMSKLMGGSSSIITVIFYAPYPILMLIFFTRETVKAAMDR